MNFFLIYIEEFLHLLYNIDFPKFGVLEEGITIWYAFYLWKRYNFEFLRW